MKNIVWTGAVFLSLAVAVGAAVGAARSGTAVPADARQAIEAANEAWIPALERQDAAAVAHPYAEDGVFVTASGETWAGPAGVEKLTRERFAAGRITAGTIVQDGIRMEGSSIYEWGHATLTVVSAGGATTHSTGRYLTVRRRGANGNWRIWRNLSLTD